MNRKTFFATIAAVLAFILAPFRSLAKPAKKTGEMKLFYRWSRAKKCLEFQYWQDGDPVSEIMDDLDPWEIYATPGHELHTPGEIVWTSPITGEKIWHPKSSHANRCKKCHTV